MTGAGRSTAAKELEDLGFYVVDNMPPSLLPDVVHLVDQGRGVAAAGRGGGRRALRRLLRLAAGRRWPWGPRGGATTLLFLEASDDVLVRRQDAARRPHPLQGSGRLIDGLTPRAQGARRRCAATPTWSSTPATSTSTSSPAGSPRRSATPDATRLKISVVSFGFKYGIPVDADFVADMRFLPNPHWVPELRPQTGQDPEVSTYVLGRDGAARFLEEYLTVLETVAAGYLGEGKRFMTVAVGCTGGKHRSVAMTEEITRRLVDRALRRQAAHRDLGRE